MYVQEKVMKRGSSQKKGTPRKNVADSSVQPMTADEKWRNSLARASLGVKFQKEHPESFVTHETLTGSSSSLGRLEDGQ